MIGGLDDLLGLVGRMGGGKPQCRTLLHAERLAGRGGGPHLLERPEQQRPRRLPLGFGLRDLRLHYRAVAQGLARQHRHLARRDLDERIECRARNAERHAGKACPEQLIAGEAVQWAFLAPVVGRFPREAVGRWHENVRYRVAVAAGALEANDMPDVVDRGARLWEQQRALHRLAIRPQPRLAVVIDDRAMTGEPPRMATAAGVGPGAAKAVAAVDD